MNKKISELTEVTNPTVNDELAIVNGGETKKIKYTNIHKTLGWGRYDDNQWTSSNPLPLVDGVEVLLSNNGTGGIVEYGTPGFYDTLTNIIQPENVNDTYILTVVFKGIAPNANSTHLDLKLYSPVGQFDRVSKVLPFDKGNNEEQNFHELFQFYADADAVNNGIQVNIAADGGSATVYDIIFFIQRTQNNG